MANLVIRPALQDDLEVLWRFLAMAAYEPDAEAAKADPSVAKYIVGWRRPGDFGFIADQNGKIAGAAWARRFSAEELKFPYGGEEIPKVSISVKPNVRGQGVGEKLMRALIGEADRRGLGLCLSVRSENPARRLTISISDGLTRRQRSSTSATRSVWPFAVERSVNGDPPSPIHLSAHSVIAKNGKARAVPIFVNEYSRRVRCPSSRYLRFAMIPLSMRPANRFERTLRGMSRSACRSSKRRTP